MKRIIKYISLFMILLFVFNLNVKANTIKNIEMDVYIDNNGNASITEIWDVYLNSGTEGYRTFSNLNNSKVTNFTVSDDTGRTYDRQSYWNVNFSFDDKAFKNAINKKNDKVELCWGISSYGDRKYTLKYNLSNIVTQYSDYQGIYFNFLNLDQIVENSKITIYSEIPFSVENSKIWAFGYNGTINFIDGKIILSSNGRLNSDQYMVGLIKFENNLFTTSNISSKSFDDIYKSAMEDVNDNNDKTEFMKKYIKERRKKENIILTVVFTFFGILLIWAICSSLKSKNKRYNNNSVTNHLNITNDNYYRDIPCNKDLSRAYFILFNYNLESEKVLRQGLIGGLFLKWINENKINIVKNKNGNYEIILFDNILIEDETEKQLYKILKLASNNDNVLGVNEFKYFSREYFSVIDGFFDKVLERELNQLKIEGVINKQSNNFYSRLDKKVEEEAYNLLGLKNYLNDFSNMSNKEYIDVKLWKEYLMFANLFGIADKVEKQFKLLYPQLVNVIDINNVIRVIANDTCRISNVSRNNAVSQKQAYESFMEKGFDRDSGGGGSSFSSGGSSSGGSSGGGFR